MPRTAKSRQQAAQKILNKLQSCHEEMITPEQCEKMAIHILIVEIGDYPATTSIPQYFQAISLDWMQKHPVDPTYQQGVLKEEGPNYPAFSDYNLEAEGRLNPRPSARMQQITRLIDHYINHAVRLDHSEFPGIALAYMGEWEYLGMNDLDDLDEKPLDPVYYVPEKLESGRGHHVRMVYERRDRQLPHVTVLMEHYNREEVGENIHVSELAAILTAITIRHGQKEFGQFNTVPVLVLSFMTPQHGRILEGYMEERKLIIRKSNMYSFEKRATAPVELFYRWLLGEPTKILASPSESHENVIKSAGSATMNKPKAEGEANPTKRKRTSMGDKENITK